ncbi:hypothetical protein [Paenilisteria weihenstephanensis]|nr:hypothetical protein [Listeria weihenstephanensis]
MEIFNEIYGTYYRVVQEILAQKRGLTRQEMTEIVRERGSMRVGFICYRS